MKLRLGRGATIAAAAVAASLFFLLCMAFYGREDFLSPEKVLERGDALRFRIASVFVEPFGAGAYLGFGLLFTWSVIAYFRESVGAVLPRLVGMAACIPSFCAMTSLASGPHEFWSGSVGTWMGDVVYRGFGPVLGWAVVGTLFLVSFAMATEYGFYSHLTSLRGSLSFPLLPPEREEEGAAGTAVLEPGTPEPVEAWKSGSAEPLSFEPSPLDLPPLDPAPEEALPVDEVPSSDAVLVDREVHLADIRSRIGAGGYVTEAELALVKDVDDRAAMADAINSLFGAPAAEVPPAAPLSPPPAVEEAADAPAAPAALADLPDLPPFLVTPASSHPLMQQQVESESPAFPPAAPVESHARVISEEEIAAAREQAAVSAAAEEVEDEVVSLKSPFIFAGVEFLPPNEELADPDAPAPAPVAEAEAVEALPAVEAAAEAPAVEPAPAPAAAPEADPAVAAFEDEYFSFGMEEEPSAAAPPPVEEPAPPVLEAEPSAIEITSVEIAPALEAAAAVEEAAGAAEALPEANWLDVAAMDLGFPPVAEGEAPAVEAVDEAMETPAPAPVSDPVADHAFGAAFLLGTPVEEEVAPDLAPAAPVEEPAAAEPVVEEAPVAELDEQASILEKLFGDPVVREEPAAGPRGPSQSEPREPPASLMPILSTPVEGVTLLTDPVVSDCLKDHGIELDIHQQVTLPPPTVVDDDLPRDEEIPAAPPVVAPVETPAAPLSAEEAAEAIVGSLSDLFGDAEPAPAAEAEAAAVEPVVVEEPPALDAHGWGTLFPFMFKEGESAEARGPVHAPPPVEEPADAAVLKNEVEEQEFAVEPVSVEEQAVEEPAAGPVVVEEQVAAPEPVEVEEQVAAVEAPAPAPEEEVAPVNEALVSRLVEEFRGEEAAPAPVEEVEVVPAVVLPEPAPAPETPGGVDELYAQAVEAVRERGRGSVVVLQRKLGIGFTRATKILDQLVVHGVLGAENASGSHPLL